MSNAWVLVVCRLRESFLMNPLASAIGIYYWYTQACNSHVKGGGAEIFVYILHKFLLFERYNYTLYIIKITHRRRARNIKDDKIQLS